MKKCLQLLVSVFPLSTSPLPKQNNVMICINNSQNLWQFECKILLLLQCEDCSVQSKNVKVQFLSHLCQRTFLLTVALKVRRNKPSFRPTQSYSCRTWSILLWALIRIPASGLSRYSQNHRTTLRSLTFLASWASENNRL